jgi:hypothetical protein
MCAAGQVTPPAQYARFCAVGLLTSRAQYVAAARTCPANSALGMPPGCPRFQSPVTEAMRLAITGQAALDLSAPRFMMAGRRAAEHLQRGYALWVSPSESSTPGWAA